MINWAKSVDAATRIPREGVIAPVTHRDCNNIPTSARHLEQVKMYAELTRTEGLEVSDKKPVR